jgi:hypothetical protein
MQCGNSLRRERYRGNDYWRALLTDVTPCEHHDRLRWEGRLELEGSGVFAAEHLDLAAQPFGLQPPSV